MSCESLCNFYVLLSHFIDCLHKEELGLIECMCVVELNYWEEVNDEIIDEIQFQESEKRGCTGEVATHHTVLS